MLFLQGCNFNCVVCHNPHTIPLETPKAKQENVEDVLNQIRQAMPYISGVTVSGGEATLQHEAVKELFQALKSRPEFQHLSTMVDSNGHADRGVWDELAPVTDGFMLDLKAFDDDLHKQMTEVTNETVKESIKYLHSIGKLYEVRLILIPDVNDAEELIRKTGLWLHGIDANMRIKINLFNNHGVRAAARDWRVADQSDYQRCLEVLVGTGLKNIR